MTHAIHQIKDEYQGHSMVEIMLLISQEFIMKIVNEIENVFLELFKICA